MSQLPPQTPSTSAPTTIEDSETPLTDHDARLASLLDAEDPDVRAMAARTLALLFADSPGEFPRARASLEATLADDSPAVRRAAADAVVSLAQTDPAVFDSPASMADSLEDIAIDLTFDRLSRAALQEGIDALRGQA